jgi:hypothetical protein
VDEYVLWTPRLSPAMISPLSPQSQCLSSWIGLEALAWIYWDTWLCGAIGFVVVIAVCGASLAHVMRTYVIPTWSCFIEYVCIPWPWCIYHYSSQHGSLTNFHHLTFSEACTNHDAWDPRVENTIGAQIDRIHAYLTCHVEISKKFGL